MRKGRRQDAGFTLVEIMMVVTIIGILSTVAIPTLQRLTLRSKKAERPLVVGRIKAAILDYYLVTGSAAPPNSGGVVVANWNPAWPPTSLKRPMHLNDPSWNVYFSVGRAQSSTLSQEIEGRLYYSYLFIVFDQPGAFSQIIILAEGDLDGDGMRAQKQYWWNRTAGNYELGGEWPDPRWDGTDDHIF